MNNFGSDLLLACICLVLFIFVKSRMPSAARKREFELLPKEKQDELLRERAKLLEVKRAKARQRYAIYEREQIEQRATSIYGPRNAQMICPHCQIKGRIRTKPLRKKVGISGGKATAAILTGGVSLLATGLSRKDNVTQAHCENCNSTWDF